MVDIDLCYTSSAELASLIRQRDLSPVELMENTLRRIEDINAKLNCFCFVYGDEAMDKAKAAEAAVVAGKPLGALHGLPVGIKDVTPTQGKRTTKGSRMYEDFVPQSDALIVSRLREAGAIMVGKTTTPEFAHAGTTASPLWGVTRNPWNPERTPGGSSGGSGAAVASGCLSMAEGTDMGGSVRIPASLCGLVGLKPSLGRIPMDILPSVFDDISHFGPLTRTVGDANLFMNCVGGPDERDIMSNPQRLALPVPGETDVTGMRIALCPDLGFYALDAQVEAAVRDIAGQLESAGATVSEVSLPWDRRISDAWGANWGVYLAVMFDAEDIELWRDRLDPVVVDYIEDAHRMSAIELKRIELLRTEMWHDLCRVFATHDALLSATMALGAYPAEGPAPAEYVDDAGKFHGLELTAAFNFLAQCPAVSVPCGFTSERLPIGAQVVTPRFDDLGAMRIAGAIEALKPWAHLRPPI